MDESSEQEVKTSDDQAEGSGAQSGHLHMDEELDGAPVFGTDEDEWEMDSSFNQKVSSQLDRNSDDDEDKVNKNKSQDGTPIINANAENSSSTIASLMDEEQTKASEESSVTPPSDPVIDIQVTQPQVEIRMPQRYVSKEPPVQSKETHYSPIIQIKDEPIDEDYDKALLPQSYTSNVKQEMESNENEADAPSDELRISSVFSVRGNNSDAVTASVASAQPSSFPVITQSTSLRGTIVLPAQTQPQFHLRLQPRAHMPPQMQTLPRMQQPMLSQAPVQHPAPPQVHAPPPTVRICCSGCSKVLQKGQTAFQRKGSNQLFCSTVCLTSFSLPSVQFTPIIAPKKTCHLCLKVIVNLKDLITIPVGPMNTLKEFCSPICLNIYKDRYEDASAEVFTQCSVCKLVKEIQHEVTHLGVVHKLCSDECFARFRSSRNLYMSYCENCGNCTASGNYHLVQIEDSIRKFCTTECISTYKQKSGKRLPCPYCQEIKNIDQMTDGTNIQGVTEFFCSQRCVALSQASPSLTGTSFPCTSCKNVAVPQYHLAISDGSIRNFCSLDCVGKFQDKMNASAPHNQINGNSHEPQNVAPSQPPTEQHPPTQTSSSSVSGQNQNPIPPYVPAPGLENSQDTMQQGLAKTPSASSKISLTCKQCNVQFSGKPEVFQYKGHSGVFCTRACCEVYKRESNVKAVCEYCKQDKVIKDIITYEKQLRYFCCEGCKLLFKHDLAKRQGVQFRFCVNCQNMTHKTVQNFFGGKLEEFCTEDCMSQYTVLFYEMAKCYGCKQQGALKESLMLYGSKKHFCDSNCLMRFCLKGLTFRQPRNSMMQFCSKAVAIPQPTNNTVSNTTTVQAPLSVSKNMPVIGGVVSLASTLPANTAVTGALPTSNASSKNIGEASTQTDAAVPGTPHRRMLKNKALMCRPITEEQGVQCQPEPPIPPSVSETVIYENGEKVRLVPFPVPIPMPVYIPVPMHLYTQYTPFPVGLPLPVPVPVVIPGSQDAAESEDHKSSLPAQSSVEDDEGDKGKDKPVSQDQGSTYSGDVESDARSTPFSWADNDEPGASGKQLNPSSELEEPQAARATSVSPEHPDLEDDFPRSSTDPGSAKDSRLLLTLKRRRKGRDGFPVKKRAEETTTEESRTQMDCEDADERQTQSFADLTILTSIPPIGSCRPDIKFTSLSKEELRTLKIQCQGRPDRFGVLLFRAVVPMQQYAKWVWTTNWDGSRGKFALPVNLRNFIIKTISKTFPKLTISDQKSIKDRINEILRSSRNCLGNKGLQMCEKTTPEEEETTTTEDSRIRVDCKEADERQTQSSADLTMLTSSPPIASCHPERKLISPSDDVMRNLLAQCRGRPDRFGVLLFRAVIPKRIYTKYVSVTNWDGSRGKFALPINLRNFIIKTVSKKFPNLTIGDQKRIKDRINEFLRSPRNGSRSLKFCEEAAETTPEEEEEETEDSQTQLDCEDADSVGQTLTPPTGSCNPDIEFTSPSEQELKNLITQCHGRPDRFGVLLFRAVVPKQQHAEWVWTTNWDGSRGKLALPVNLRNFIIEIVSKKFPSLTVCDQKCIKNRINEILRAPRFALEARRTHFYEEEEEEMTPEEEETTTEESRTQQDCEDADTRQKPSSVDSTDQTAITPVVQCHPRLEFTAPSRKQLKMLMGQCQGRPDRYACLLFRAILPEKIYAEWATTTNWNGSCGKFALPMNLKQFIFKTVTQKFPNLTNDDRKRIISRIQEFLRSPRNGVGPGFTRTRPKVVGDV